MSSIRQWMRKEDVYDKDLEEILESFGVQSPDDFQNLTENQWDQVFREATVTRFQELKDMDARKRLEKKLGKIEKFWRQQSGIKKTNQIKGMPESPKSDKDPTSLDSGDLRKWMQKNQVWEKDLFIVLQNYGITTPEDISTIDVKTFDKIVLEVNVLRREELKDPNAKNRLEKLLKQFEKLWREMSGIPNLIDHALTGQKPIKKEFVKQDPAKVNKQEVGSPELKSWMQKEEIWEKDLYDKLLSYDITQPVMLESLTQKQFDDIVRSVRVERFTELKDQESRNRLDKKLVAFEKLWRQASGIKKTMIQK